MLKFHKVNRSHRGALLGALLGAASGIEAFRERWIKGLVYPPPELMKGVAQR